MIIAYTTYVVSIAIIITKYFDCITTQRKIGGVAMEFNPIARALMHCLGIKTTIWLGLCHYYCGHRHKPVLDSIPNRFYSLGLRLYSYSRITALIQGATAVNNYNGRPNFVTKQLFRLLAKRP